MIEIVRTRIGVLTYLAPTSSLSGDEELLAFTETIDSCIKSHEINLIVDLARVSTVTGVIIETFLDTQDKLVKIGGYLKVVNANALVKDIFMITNFSTYVSVIEAS